MRHITTSSAHYNTDPQDPIERILTLLENVKRSGSGWTARCPSHNDEHNSLCIGSGGDGRALLDCKAGCGIERVVARLGLTMADLFPSPTRKRRSAQLHVTSPAQNGSTDQRPQHQSESQQQQSSLAEGCTLEQYALEKQLPVPFLRGLGVSDARYMGQVAIRIPYWDERGITGAIRYRTALHKSKDIDKRFRWKSGAKLCLYGLWKLEMARQAGYIVLCEGESDAHTLWHHNIPAVSIPGASNWREEWAAHLQDIPTIFAVIEPDKGGEAILAWLTGSAIRERVKLVRLAGAKDPSELHMRAPDSFDQSWQQAMASAIPWPDHAETEEQARVEKAWERCQNLAKEPDILARFEDELLARGFAGETRAAKLIYLALITRVFSRPISLALKGPSSAGKSYTVEQTLRFFPPDSYYALSAMSERALAYSKEPLSNRFLVLYEAAGLGSRFAQYLVRSLLSEGRLRYETVEKTNQGLRARFIEREGPTGLLITTTAIKWHDENETRLFSVPVADTPEQTRKVLLALADENELKEEPLPDEWPALQEWLVSAEHRVTIPYAKQLAYETLAVSVRLRRDFLAVLNLIRGHAMLHQANRDRGSQGMIIATLRDYAAVRSLIVDLISEGVEATVSPTVRETVEAVKVVHAKTDEPVSVAQIARHLNIDKSAASRRVRNCLELGYVRNLETTNGKPFKLEISDPLPDNQEILPLPKQLQDDGQARNRCSVDQGKAEANNVLDISDYMDAEEWIEISPDEPVPGAGVYRFDAQTRKTYKRVQIG